jgi:hypothetical protein
MKRLAQLLFALLLAAPCCADGDLGYKVITGDGLSPTAVPWANPDEINRSPFGKPAGKEPAASAPEEIVSRQRVEGFRGTGITTANDGHVFDVVSGNNYTGASIGSDSIIERATLKNNRDVGLLIRRDSGNAQSKLVHCYGARVACYDEASGWTRANGDTYADCFVGLYSAGWNATRENILFQHCRQRDAVVRGLAQTFNRCTFMIQREVIDSQRTFTIPGQPYYDRKAGVQVEGSGHRFDACYWELTNWWLKDWSGSGADIDKLSGRPALAAIIVDGDELEFNGRVVDADTLAGSTLFIVRNKHTGLKCRLDTSGFTDAPDKLIAFEPGAAIAGADLEFRIRPGTKPLSQYLPDGDWRGRIVINDIEHNTKLTVEK